MKTQTKLLATLIAASLLTACSDDDNNAVITDPNTPPVAVEITAETTSNTAIMIDALTQASDADGDTLTLATATATHGTATIKDGQIEYDPAGFFGNDVIDYSVSDGTDATAAQILVTVTKEVVVLEYVGSESCQSCHAEAYAAHQKSGHNFKITKIDGEQPVFPYYEENGVSIDGAMALITNVDADGNEVPTMNTLGAPTSYADVTYTSGGYWKKIRWFDANGHIVTGTSVQYNLYGSDATGNQMSSYHATDVDMIYNCGNCHNTGWKPFTTGEYEQRQDDLAGFGGTFAMAGVQCEACHGAASEHINSPSKDNITRKAEPRTTASLQSETMGYGEAMHCAECHTRDGNRSGGDAGNNYVNGYKTAFPDGEEFGGRIAVKGGLPRHHQGHDELMGIDPDTGLATNPHYNAGMSCDSCHNPHKSTVNMDNDSIHEGAVKSCSTCHQTQDFNDGVVNLHKNFACTDCHMPEAVKNATSTEKNGNLFGDEMIHTFKIDLFNEKGQFTEDGKFMYPYLKDGFACGSCHEAGSKLQSLTDNYGGKIHK
ncbi:Cytochrome c554 and c-prime [Ferrimonas sediminum]|uniref:Cytochrome c554 and c-prime n=1 Tax=Ferrimonas sediminum TaxID=718193 RepID=A0A1G8JF57_9GAMM|nr:Ig-like domain-containing protein [Ferrimonas sediminum]SDI29711.1 Cytochrome c554 and c-prime [Ferrimonas sediminum]